MNKVNFHVYQMYIQMRHTLACGVSMRHFWPWQIRGTVGSGQVGLSA